ncbi:hypothetical protein [Ornithinibacillus bavariensis]|uniref:hypothetical protein n=1 Tax=Ornithinibacillus bavariensis TaxID=545502 RepID=UPI000EDA09A9|nr:hypothetical protein [Ornithinibacillus sp.]
MVIRNYQKRFLILFLIVMIIGMLAVVLFFTFVKSPSSKAKAAVEEFYAYEQDGNFAESWKMFHPFMKERLEKNQYIEDRVQALFNDNGVHTFSFTVDDPELIKNWQVDEDSEPIEEVYKTEVRQFFEGIFGNFEIVQSVYVTSLDGEWTVLWDYNESEDFLKMDEN